MFKYIFILVIVLLFMSCKSNKPIDANTIITTSIDISGGSLVKTSKITFDFRDKHYISKRNNGNYSLGRISSLNSDSVFDILTNTGFERFINKVKVKVPDSMATKYSSSINSVHYFSILPYVLNDKAVNKEYLGQVNIKGEEFYKIKVTFNQSGGGEDFEDVFLYYINIKNFKMQYLAYSYNEDDGLGYRFRAAYNERFVEGVRFVDYYNYKPENNDIDFYQIDYLFENNKLELLSKIELENIKVLILSEDS